MSRHADPVKNRDRRKVVGALVAVGGLVVTAGGVYAGLNATAFNTSAQAVSSGTLKLVMANGTGSVGFGQSISDLAPGDVVNRFVDVTDTGTINAQSLTLAVADATPTKLTTDGTNGLHVTVKSCTVAWVAATGTCADIGGPATVVNNAALSSLSSTPATLVGGAVTKNSAYHYEISLTLPDQSETTQNGTLPNNTIQGLSASLTWTFSEAQRAATTTNG
jgi:spore coat-associated protein N